VVCDRNIICNLWKRQTDVSVIETGRIYCVVVVTGCEIAVNETNQGGSAIKDKIPQVYAFIFIETLLPGLDKKFYHCK